MARRRPAAGLVRGERLLLSRPGGNQPTDRTRPRLGEVIGTGNLVHLDLMRGLAAVVVVVGHLRELFFVHYGDIAGHPSPVVQAVYFVSGFGHQAVMVFFVLSGFLIGSSVIAGVSAGTFIWRDYLLHRLVRLWVVLLPALLLGAAWDLGGIMAFGTGGVYGGHLAGVLAVQGDVGLRLAPAVLAGNVLFVQDILVPTFGSNGPLWSLSYELWYYILFPLLALVVAASGRLRRMGAAALAIAIGLFVGPSIAGYFAVWLLGAALAFMVARERRRLPVRFRNLVIGIGCLPLLATLAAERVLPAAGTPLRDGAVALAFAVLLASLLLTRGEPGGSSGGFETRMAPLLAGQSYTLYLVNLPILVFLSAWLVPGGRWQPGRPWFLPAFAALLAIVLAYSFLVASLTEARTAAVRTSVARLLRLA